MNMSRCHRSNQCRPVYEHLFEVRKLDHFEHLHAIICGRSEQRFSREYVTKPSKEETSAQLHFAVVRFVFIENFEKVVRE